LITYLRTFRQIFVSGKVRVDKTNYFTQFLKYESKMDKTNLYYRS